MLLILVEEMSHFLVLTVSARDGFSDIYSYHGVKDECCIKDYFNRVYWNVEKEKNNFDQTIIIYKNTNAIKHIFILK